MIAMWMLYTIVISATLAAAAAALEFVARALGAPTRFVWGAALAGSLVLSLLSIARAPQQIARVATPNAIGSTATAGNAAPLGAATVGAPQSRPSAFSKMLRIARGRFAEVAAFDAHRLDAWNTPLLATCVLIAALAFGYLGAGAVRVRRIMRRLEARTLDGHAVLVSADIGPALFGITRPQIVVPAWVLELPAADRRVILTHEVQHAAANDPALLLVCSAALALQAWNPLLWLIVARLRLAIETDCDRRVLRHEAGDVRAYGRLLVTVYERVAPVFASPIAFAERPSNLEVRIRRMTERAPRLASVAGIGAACLAVALVTAAWVTPAPVRPAQISSGVEKQARQREESVCGFGPTSNSLCAIEADVFIRVVDTTRVMIALREAPGTNREVEHVLLVQSRQAIPDLLTRIIRNAYVEYRGGEVYVSSPVTGELAVIFTAGRDTEIADRHPNAIRFANLVGISHYSPGLVDFDDVPNIRRLATCDVEGHVCYESSRRSFTFP